jgi:transcriptional regulator with XRE-family HTH domain
MTCEIRGQTEDVEQKPLARNLRAWRERVQPASAGLPATSRRRTPGLRREELAALAGVSTEYIVRLEQGRAAHPSPQVLSAIGRALRLSATETSHLFHLAGISSPGDDLIPRHITPGVTRIADRLGDTTAVVVCTSAWETIYWNPLWAALLGDPARARGRERNFAWRHFTGLPTQLSHTPDALAEFEHDMVCDLRRTLDRYPAERDLARMCQTLRRHNERFARLWDSGDIARHRSVRKTVHHPVVGPVTVDCDVLTAPDSELYVVVFTAEPGSEDASRLDLLRVMGIQSFARAD